MCRPGLPKNLPNSGEPTMLFTTVGFRWLVILVTPPRKATRRFPRRSRRSAYTSRSKYSGKLLELTAPTVAPRSVAIENGNPFRISTRPEKDQFFHGEGK